MRLYKMELYKLCHRKSFAAGFLFVLLTALFFFYDGVQSQVCFINGVEYYGFEAIQANRQIVEEFRGILTDEKVNQIIDQYGFPQEPVPMDRYNRLQGNFLNNFVMDYVSNGYNNDWDDYRPATETIPLENTDLGRYHAAAGMEIILEYYDGWRTFLDGFGVLMLGVNLLILYAVSTVFSEEEQAGMKSLLFTTKNGPSADTLSKIGAAFSVSAGIWFFAVSFYLFLCCTVYGTDGLGCIAGIVTGQVHDYENPLLLQSIGAYLTEKLLVSLLAILELCAITICVSARCHNSFHAVVAAGICYALPFLGFVLYRSGTALLMIYTARHPLNSVLLTICLCMFYLLHGLIYSSPVYLSIARDTLIEISYMSRAPAMKHIYITLTIAAVLFLFCTISAYRNYRRPQKA